MHYTYGPTRPHVDQGGLIQAQHYAAHHQPQTHPDNGFLSVMRRSAQSARQQIQEILPGIQPQTAANGPAVAPSRNPLRPRNATARLGKNGCHSALREPDAYDEEGDSVYFDED
jgi:hypothetical protein